MIHAIRLRQRQRHEGFKPPAILDSTLSLRALIPLQRILPLSSQEGP
jgi:hypothetical protein